MAPEAAEVYTVSADIYSFSLCLFELVFAPNPFRKMTGIWFSSPSSLYRFFDVDPTVVRRALDENFRPEFPQVLEALEPLKQLIEDCWQKDPKSRPTATAIYERLSLFHLPGLISACPVFLLFLQANCCLLKIPLRFSLLG
jgi:hypothetical protein